MKLFDIAEVPPKTQPYLKIQKHAVDMILQICKLLQISIPAMHASLWVFHCNAIIMGFHKFDRYIYACGAILVGTKLMQCIKYPTQILSACRKSLRKAKNLQFDQDSEQYLKKEVFKVFEAQVNIMINIGFDFDVQLGVQQAEKIGLFSQLPIENGSTKLRQTLTSLYETDVVVLFSPQQIALLALSLLIKAESRNFDSLELDEKIKERLMAEQIKQAEKQYLQRCPFV